MRVGVLGSGLMSGKLGTLFARAGHEVYSAMRDLHMYEGRTPIKPGRILGHEPWD